jgi:hypothetical protein
MIVKEAWRLPTRGPATDFGPVRQFLVPQLAAIRPGAQHPTRGPGPDAGLPASSQQSARGA